MSDLNIRDVAFKAFWTGLAAVLGVLVTYAADWPYAWAPVLVVAVNAVLAVVRQKAGATPTSV